MDSQFCVEALKEAMEEFGQPGIFNTDQGAQFTSKDFTSVLLDAGVKVSMDGRGRFMDNIFVERLWRSVKCEEVYLNDYADVSEARTGIGKYLKRYNEPMNGAHIKPSDTRLRRNIMISNLASWPRPEMVSATSC